MAAAPPPQYPAAAPAPQYHTTTVITKEEPSSMRKAIPQLPWPLALACCILNFFLPGIGKFCSFFSSF